MTKKKIKSQELLEKEKIVTNGVGSLNTATIKSKEQMFDADGRELIDVESVSGKRLSKNLW
jgi:hypothetical protein